MQDVNAKCAAHTFPCTLNFFYLNGINVGQHLTRYVQAFGSLHPHFYFFTLPHGIHLSEPAAHGGGIMILYKVYKKLNSCQCQFNTSV